MVSQSNRARLRRNSELARKDPTLPPRREYPEVDRPWRQWHTASKPQQAAALEVAVPKRPQWGRYIYLTIIVVLVALVVRNFYDKIFWISAQGEIAGRQYSVSSADTVSIREILVSPSDTVEEGQVLAVLDSPELKQELARNEAEIARIQAELSQTNYKIESDRHELQSNVEMYAAQLRALEMQSNRESQQIDALRQLVEAGAVAGEDLNMLLARHFGETLPQQREAAARLNGSRQQLADLQKSQEGNEPMLAERLDALKQLHAVIQNQIDNLQLRAPVSGLVAQVGVSKGDILKPGDPAAIVVDRSELRAYLYFPPEAQSRLRNGQLLTVDAPGGAQLPLRVTKLYPAMELLPDQFQPEYRQKSAALIVEAVPSDGGTFGDELTSGTPIRGSIPRWGIPGLAKETPTEKAADSASTGTEEQTLLKKMDSKFNPEPQKGVQPTYDISTKEL